MTVPALVIAIPIILAVIVVYAIGAWKFIRWMDTQFTAWADAKLDSKYPDR